MSDSPTEKSARSEPTEGDADIRMFAMLCHLLNLTLVGGFIIWMVRREDSPFIDRHGKESVNFLITWVGTALAFFLIGVLIGPIPILGRIAQIFFIFLGLGVVILGAAFCTIAGLKANEGREYRYPFSCRLIK